MPLRIIQQNINEIKCDAKVTLLERGGVLLSQRKEGKRVAEIRPASCPLCKYVISLPPPLDASEIVDFYTEALELAAEYKCKTVALPMVARDAVYGSAIATVSDAIGKFLFQNEMLVYIAVERKPSRMVNGALFLEVSNYIDRFFPRRPAYPPAALPKGEKLPPCSPPMSISVCSEENSCFLPRDLDELDGIVKNLDRGFADILFSYIDERKMTDVEAYKLSNVGKKTFSKIKCNKDYRPSKITAVSFAIGLHLNLEETKRLLASAGMCLSHSCKFDVIIEYFIVSGRYTSIFEVNEVLYQFDQPLLGV